MEDYVCPACGGDLKKWLGDILECSDCGNMMDKEVMNEMLDESEEEEFSPIVFLTDLEEEIK
ncbi:hypothetical protein PSC83_001113 [Listeria monocytogenes]|nr:hypothetical protein [Listeria monocytogenes]